jgi:hypothetical protein
MSNVGAGHAIVVAVRNGQSAPQTSISNSSLKWTVVAGHQNSQVGWRHDVHCAIAPSGGNQNFTVNTNGGNVGIRVIAVEYTGVSCTGTKFTVGQGTSSTATSGSITTTTSGLIFSSFATDTDIDGNGKRSISGYTIRDDNCNTLPGVEPDQKLCVADKGIQPAGTYSATWNFGGDSWDDIIVAFPQGGGGGGGGDATPPAAPTGLTVR